ncbi:MAG: pyruvate kinase [Saprospiraceae bacterium]
MNIPQINQTTAKGICGHFANGARLRGSPQHIHPHYSYSARNLLRYLRLRTFDIRKMQAKLSELGLSSISHSERYVLANIENILHFLCLYQGVPAAARFLPGMHPVNATTSQQSLEEHTRRLFPVHNHGRNTRVMVTLPSDATEYEVVKELFTGGMDMARINCSHDDIPAWEQMIENIKKAREDTGRQCAIYMDMAGTQKAAHGHGGE